MLAPDGKHYTYQGPDGVHNVDLVTGADRTVLSNPPGVLLQYADDGIYLSKYGAYAGHLGLWRLNPQTAELTQVLPESVAFDELGSGAAWYIEPRSEAPTPSTLYRIDLTTRQRQVWFSQPNIWVVHLGTDPLGRPLVGWIDLQTSGDTTIATMTAAGQSTVIQRGPQETVPWLVAATDSHGLWFRSGQAKWPLWLLQPNDQVITVAQAGVQPLGACN